MASLRTVPIPSSVENFAFDKASATGLQQAKLVSKQPMCKHMGDAASCKDGDAGAVKNEIFNRTRYNIKPMGIKSWMVHSWWMVLFTAGCFFIYSQAMHKKSLVAESLQDHLKTLDEQKVELLAEREDLLLQINSQSDPAWIQLTLMKGLGLVPEGQTKVFFHNESKDPVNEAPAA